MTHALRIMLTCLPVIVFTGCALPPMLPSQAVSNPIVIPATNQEAVWERTVDVIHDYQYPILQENKFDGLIQTDYKVGAGILEPWQRDAVGLENRWEGSLQSIRRRAFITVTPVDQGHLIGIQVYKELEDLPGKAANSPGGATFQEAQPLKRDLNLVVGQSAPSGWIPLGRDLSAEQDFLRRLQSRCARF